MRLTSVPRPVKLRFVDVDSGVVTLKELQEGRYARTSLSKAHLDALLQEPPPSPESPPVESRDAVPTTSPEPFLAPPPLPPPPTPFVVTVAPSTHVAPATQAIPLPPPTYTTEHVYKLILLGTTGVGKSSVLSVGVGGAAAFSDRPAATLEAEFGTLCVPDPDVATNKMLKAQVWDTAGQERYRAMTRSHYRRADGALLVYDVADPESFDKLAGWLADLREMAGDSIKSILVLENKIDQLPDAVVSGVEPRPSQFVNEAAVAAFCKVNGLLFARSSAKMNRTAFRWAGKPVEEVVGQLLLNVHATHLARGLKLQQEQLAKQLVSQDQVVATSSSTPIVLCASPSIARTKSGDCGCGGT
ncbi:hypothetical protein DYB37_008848 [Aphanomyces astaci]|uniref:Uncharacterized protein n=1 Tax=Aphanomyces astaci TaxID=112090 RepID=A0A3R7BKS3_APHAT|nr:hypothetical protein DYB35_006100 [Aphanomyces astaci]RHZ15525.1 hypothetical protein DYB37_008848 [Aphanomyces astaci]